MKNLRWILKGLTPTGIKPVSYTHLELAFGPENLCVDREEIGLRMNEILGIINMEEYRHDNPNNLSGGQQQLIAIASTLMLKPSILICDEIMSWIDDEGRAIIKDIRCV